MKRILAALAFSLATTACAAIAAPHNQLPVFSRMPASKLPPQGMYDSCGPEWSVSQCEAKDLQMSTANGTVPAGKGYTLRVDFIGLATRRADQQKLLAYDATIGVTEYIAVGTIDQDGPNGTALINEQPTITKDCRTSGPIHTNGDLLRCVDKALRHYKAFGGFYIYDEPGCPFKDGFCHGSIKPQQDTNVIQTAIFLSKLDPKHLPWGGNTPGGVPPCGWAGSCAQTNENKLYQWLADRSMPRTAYDYYPIGTPNESTDDIAYIGADVQTALHTIYPDATAAYIGQAFSWTDYGRTCNGGPCPIPTAAQMLAMRNNALQSQPWAIWWYSQDDINCLIEPPPNCNATANWKAVNSAAFAPYNG